MTPQEKAEEILKKFDNNINSSLISLEIVEQALYDYGDQSMELQNMDSEFRFWDSVKTHIKTIGYEC